MSTKLSESELAEIREAMTSGDAELMYVTTSGDNMRALLDHITALEEELKAAQAGLEYVKGMNRHLSNNDAANAIHLFRTQLVEAVRAKFQAKQTNFMLSDEIMQLIQTFEAREVK